MYQRRVPQREAFWQLWTCRFNRHNIACRASSPSLSTMLLFRQSASSFIWQSNALQNSIHPVTVKELDTEAAMASIDRLYNNPSSQRVFSMREQMNWHCHSIPNQTRSHPLRMILQVPVDHLSSQALSNNRAMCSRVITPLLQFACPFPH